MVTLSCQMKEALISQPMGSLKSELLGDNQCRF
jgi:hypothetical protein